MPTLPHRLLHLLPPTLAGLVGGLIGSLLLTTFVWPVQLDCPPALSGQVKAAPTTCSPSSAQVPFAGAGPEGAPAPVVLTPVERPVEQAADIARQQAFLASLSSSSPEMAVNTWYPNDAPKPPVIPQTQVSPTVPGDSGP
jgi:hypothetical protein